MIECKCIDNVMIGMAR